MYVTHENSYDNFHKDADRIYHIPMSITMGESPYFTTSSSGPLAQALRDDYPEVEFASRILRTNSARVVHENETYFERNFLWAEKEMFDIFSITMIKGDPKKAMEEPNRVLLTNSLTKKYFGDEDPIGKSLLINNVNYEIVGIMEDAPTNTIMKYSFVVSVKNYRIPPEEMTYWPDHYGMTYIKLKERVDPAEFEMKIEMIAHKYYGDYFKMRGWTYACFMQPLQDIHLHSEIGGGFEPPGSILYVYALSIIGILILTISCLNYINLSSARSTIRSTEIGIRKVSGAHRHQLVFQFLGESFFMTVAAFVAAVLLLSITLPYFNELVQKQFSIGYLLHWSKVAYALLLLVTTAIAAGLYPAVLSSGFRPIMILSKRLKLGNNRSFLRKSLIISQFSITIILIFGTIAVYKQIDYMKNRELGLDLEQKVTVNARFNNNYESVKNEFLKHPGIIGCTASSGLFSGYSTVTTRLISGEFKEIVMTHLSVDHDFIPDFSIQMAAGRPFNINMKNDVNGAYILNETAAQMFGWSSQGEAVGQTIQSMGREEEDKRKVIGVVKDFHFEGLQNKIQPLVMYYDPNAFNTLDLTLKSDNISETLSYIEAKWNELKLGRRYSLTFLDETYNNLYMSEQREGDIFTLFSALAIFLSCFGLVGVSSFTAECRTKEIGIRKVLGASFGEVVFLLLGEFVKSILLSIIIATPIAWYTMNNWLRNFAYHISLGWSLFFISGLLALVVALLTLSYQSFRSANANPVKSLRYE
jgi:putative ABC transport system permease protein